MTMLYYSIPTSMEILKIKLKKLKWIISVDKEIDKLKDSCIAGYTVILFSHYRKEFGNSSKSYT